MCILIVKTYKTVKIYINIFLLLTLEMGTGDLLTKPSLKADASLEILWGKVIKLLASS